MGVANFKHYINWSLNNDHVAQYEQGLLIDHMQLYAYLIRNRAPHVINNQVHVAVAILSGKRMEW